MAITIINKKFRHFKGNYYNLLLIATHTETNEMMAVYQALYEDYRIFTRPFKAFTIEKAPQDSTNKTGQKYRFEEVED